MSDEPNSITLGGQAWVLRPLPFRVLKKVQPQILRRNVSMLGQADLNDPKALVGIALRLDEESLDDLADAAFACVTLVDPAITREVFYNLPITSAQLLGAMPAIFRSCGLEVRSAPPGEGGEEKKA